MALGVVTPVISNLVHGSERVTITTVVIGTAYPTGGVALTAAQLGLQNVAHAVTSLKVVGANGPSEAYYDIVNSKLKAFSATGEVANATDLSGATVEITAFGF